MPKIKIDYSNRIFIQLFNMISSAILYWCLFHFIYLCLDIKALNCRTNTDQCTRNENTTAFYFPDVCTFSVKYSPLYKGR